MKILHSLTLLGFISMISLIFASPVSANTCRSLYDDGDYEAAISLCQKEKSYFELGLIYQQKKDCLNMEKNYRLTKSGAAKGNLGLSFINGYDGCEKNVVEGIKLLKEAISKGQPGYANDLGDHFKKENNKALAKTYYKKSIKLGPYAGDWEKGRARQSHTELVKFFNNEEKKKFYLKNLELPNSPNEWENEMADMAFQGLKNVLNTSEKLNLFFKDSTRKAEYRCEIGEDLYNRDFQTLLVEIQKQRKKDKFIGRLCEGQKEYFLALTFENGFGNKEDFREAYRLFLMAGSKGNINAKSARDRIRDKLSPEQISEATCLADYGLEPSMYGKWKCGW
jgi:TPR repeat protein